MLTFVECAERTFVHLRGESGSYGSIRTKRNELKTNKNNIPNRPNNTLTSHQSTNQIKAVTHRAAREGELACSMRKSVKKLTRQHMSACIPQHTCAVILELLKVAFVCVARAAHIHRKTLLRRNCCLIGRHLIGWRLIGWIGRSSAC